MNSRYYDDEDPDEIPRDREISLGAPTLLGIFFLLALVCAVFFGFGYSFGRKSSSAAITTASNDSVEASSIHATGAAKPSAAETPESEPAPASEPDETTSAADTTDAAPAVATPTSRQSAARLAPVSVTRTAAAPSVSKPAPMPAVATVTPPAIPHAAAAPAAGGAPSIVQVAAVSHKEDADVLLNALKHRGYAVSVRHEPQDKLLHIQIGPLASRKDADTMRQRLLADGYKAIIK